MTPVPLHTPPDELFLGLQTALAGEYSIERELGSGGMGVVYLAREVRLAREVAIKVLPPELALSPELREQFLREAQMAARLSHPNIVPIHRVDEAGGYVYFVMAYIAGETLAQRVATRGPLPPHQAARILREVAWALTYAHASGIVHRDVKADNILLERGTERALVTDFGIASAAHVDARRADGLIAGSAYYASPEQIAGEPVDAASDIYSLGVTGFLTLTGRLPFDAPTVPEVVAMHLNTRPPAIVSLAPTVTPRLAQIIERCLNKRPEQRYASAAGFAEALEQAVEPPREIPPAIRVWLSRRRQTRAGMVLGAYVGLGIAMPASMALQAPALGVVLGTLFAVTLGTLPALYRTRRVLGAGYDINDLRMALREHWARRREEIAYEWGTEKPGSTRTIKWVAGISAVVAAGCGALLATPLASPVAGVGMMVGTGAAVASGIIWLSRVLRARQTTALGSRHMRFYDGKWGQRWVRLAGLGLKRNVAAQPLAQLTEVALGRATDALYDALPKPLRKQLKELPSAVRRLEEDAKKLRIEVEKLDQSIATLDADAAGAMPSAVAASSHEERLRADRDRLCIDLRLTRERAAERLAATVAALENIRLDLMRLQLGDGRIDSVTASLDAAQRVASDLGAYADASEELDATLRAPRSPRAPLA